MLGINGLDFFLTKETSVLCENMYENYNNFAYIYYVDT
jgi:hypothetical protein